MLSLVLKTSLLWSVARNYADGKTGFGYQRGGSSIGQVLLRNRPIEQDTADEEHRIQTETKPKCVPAPLPTIPSSVTLCSNPMHGGSFVHSERHVYELCF